MNRLPDRIFDKVVPEPMTGCWLWTAHVHEKGYGKVRWMGRMKFSHRVVYELLVGAIPDGLTLDHKCRQRCCVNPDHLEPVTSVENVLRGNGWTAVNARKTHCLRGHELSGANLYVQTRGARVCRTCYRAGRAERRRRRRLEKVAA